MTRGSLATMSSSSWHRMSSGVWLAYNRLMVKSRSSCSSASATCRHGVMPEPPAIRPRLLYAVVFFSWEKVGLGLGAGLGLGLGLGAGVGSGYP